MVDPSVYYLTHKPVKTLPDIKLGQSCSQRPLLWIKDLVARRRKKEIPMFFSRKTGVLYLLPWRCTKPECRLRLAGTLPCIFLYERWVRRPASLVESTRWGLCARFSVSSHSLPVLFTYAAIRCRPKLPAITGLNACRLDAPNT